MREDPDTYARFCAAMNTLNIEPRKKSLAAVSGGPDSMALCHMLSRWSSAEKGAAQIHAVTVDHCLRPGSADEARQVGAWLKDWLNVRHTILTWEGGKPKTRIMEEAREMRRKLLAQYAHKEGLNAILLAHHKDDQAETFLMRLASGSGLDGLCGMSPVQEFDGIRFMRPLLAVKKAELVAYCAQNHVPYIDDPSNSNPSFLRPRLRKSMHVLEKEGLSPDRLARTAMRLDRARDALDYYTERAFEGVLLAQKEGSIAYDRAQYVVLPEEIRLRLLLRAIDALSPERAYRPRLEKIESIAEDLAGEGLFRKRTLGGLVYSVRGEGREIYIEKENKD